MKYQKLLGIGIILLASGCSGKTPSGKSDSNSRMDSTSSAAVNSHDSHDHATKGPHSGTLIELGNEKYHAELLHDKESVIIYILDGSATKANPIDTTEVVINLVHDGKPSQFQLTASPDSEDPVGKSSRFILKNARFIEELEHAESGAKLNVLIDGKSYRGDIHHNHKDHNHDGLDHAH